MSDDRQEPPAGEHDDDRTRPLPPPAGDRPEPTEPAADRPGSTPAGTDPDDTAPIPPPWSGRAEVRSPRPDDPSSEWYIEEQGGRRWWLPILWGVLALLLAGLLGGALWVLRGQQDDDRDDPGPTPSLPPTSAPTAPPTSAAPTSASPTSESPSSPATTSTPDEVPVPPLTGLPQATAEGLLARLGLTYRVVYRPSELPPGTVVGTEPEAGTSVSTDDEVLLIIAQAQPPAGTSPTTPSPTVTSTS
ncbi:PASTA domain-containing protein [Micromonospora violae]|uniref:PASTA domain-containing protein n=1 Tax=Micromonospora violae TaxID=1278207 RepID=A0A4Q7UMV1_9ACTN|nr:PASTA domain-containing protein [Micromonospora violae]RZT81858.1 PASTA domain-containing protein [Micromonospora violae]